MLVHEMNSSNSSIEKERKWREKVFVWFLAKFLFLCLGCFICNMRIMMQWSSLLRLWWSQEKHLGWVTAVLSHLTLPSEPTELWWSNMGTTDLTPLSVSRDTSRAVDWEYLQGISCQMLPTHLTYDKYHESSSSSMHRALDSRVD